MPTPRPAPDNDLPQNWLMPYESLDSRSVSPRRIDQLAEARHRYLARRTL